MPLTRADLAAIPSYRPGRTPDDVARELGLTEAIKLASNEVPATANSGQTLGKRMLGIRVLRADDQLLSFGQSLRRWIILWLPSPLVSFLCGLPLALADLLWCLWDRPARQCLHDKAVFSIVVRTERATAAGGSGTAGAPGP